jgi:hypothetical protein
MSALPYHSPMGLGDLLDRAFRLYRARFGRLVLTAAVFFVPLGLLSALLLGVTMSSYFDLLLNAVDQPAALSDGELFAAGGLGIASALIVGLLGLILGALAFLAMLAQAEATVGGRELTVMASIRAGLGRFWPFVGLSLLVTLISFGVLIAIYIALFAVMLVFAGVFAALGAITDQSGIVAVGAVILIIMLVFGLIFVVLLPFAYLTTRWMMAPVVIVTERLGPTGALSRSWRLTEGSFWRLFGLLILLFILNSIVLSLPITLIQFVAIALATPQVLGLINGVMTGLSYLINILWLPFLALTLLLLYYDLRIRKENYDLDLRIQALEAITRPATLPPS